MKKFAATLALILALLSLSPGIAEDSFQSVDFTEVAGYYTVGEDNYLFMPNGDAYAFTVQEVSDAHLWTPQPYAAYSDGTRFIIDDLDGAMACFVPRPEMGATRSGGIYYTAYMYYSDTLDEGLDEDTEIAFGNYVFDNESELCIRQPLSAFFGFTGDSGASDRIEGSGYASPEDAVTAYIEAFQRNDLEGMLSTFAVETFAERYDLAKEVERLGLYSISDDYIPNISGYSNALNVESRRSRIVDSIRCQYLTLTEAACADGLIIQKEADISGEDFVAKIFATEDRSLLSEMDFREEFLPPDALSERYREESIQRNIAGVAQVCGGDEMRCVAAKLQIAGDPYILCVSAIRYGDAWYNCELGGALGSLLQIDALSGGLSPYPIPED